MAAPARPQTLRDRISFEIGKPVEIALDGTGTPTESLNRDDQTEYRYFLAGHSIMWVPPAVHETIQRADGGPGAIFAITRKRAPTPWSVIHLEAEEPADFDRRMGRPPEPEPAPVSYPRSAAPQQQQPAPRPAPTPAPATAAPLNSPPSSYSQNLYTCLCAATRAAAEAEKFAAQIGRPVVFDSADLRAMAATLYIQQQKGGVA